MTKRDEAILASMNMSADEVDAIAEACEADDYGMWDSSEVSHANPLVDEMMTISLRLPKSRVEALRRASERNGMTRSELVRHAIDRELMATA